MNPIVIALLALGAWKVLGPKKEETPKKEEPKESPQEPVLFVPPLEPQAQEAIFQDIQLPFLQAQAEAKQRRIEADEAKPTFVDAKILRAAVETGQKAVFFKPHKAIDVNKGLLVQDAIAPKNDQAISRLTIVVTSWEDFRYFSNLLAIAFVLAEGNQKEIGEAILDWFMYHRWIIGKTLKTSMLEQAWRFTCAYDSRLPTTSTRSYPKQRFPSGLSPVQGGARSVYPALDDWGYSYYEDKKVPKACHAQDIASIGDRFRCAEKRLGKAFFGESETIPLFKGQSTFTRGITWAQIGPPGCMLEYAAARYGMLGYCTAINPKLGAAVGSAILDVAGAAASMIAAGVVSAVAGATAATPVGWVAAAVAAAIAAFNAIFGAVQLRQKTWNTRKIVANKLDLLFRSTAAKYGVSNPSNGLLGIDNGLKNLCGSRIGILLPNYYSWNDIDDLLWHNFALGNSADGFGNALAQVPFYIVGIDFCMTISVAVLSNKILCLKPNVIADGRTYGFEAVAYTFEEYEKILKESIGKQVKTLSS